MLSALAAGTAIKFILKTPTAMHRLHLTFFGRLFKGRAIIFWHFLATGRCQKQAKFTKIDQTSGNKHLKSGLGAIFACGLYYPPILDATSAVLGAVQARLDREIRSKLGAQSPPKSIKNIKQSILSQMPLGGGLNFFHGFAPKMDPCWKQNGIKYRL